MDLINIKFDEQYQKNGNSDKDFSQLLIEWVERQSNLPHITEYEAMLFLNATNQHLDQAKKFVTDYYTFRTCNPEIFANRNIFSNDMKIAKSNGMYVPLPGVTKEGYKVLYGKIIMADASEFDVIKFLKIIAFSMDLWIQQKGITTGDVIIFDAHSCTIDHAKKMIEAVKPFMTMLQDIFLGRLKGFHFINTTLESDSVDMLVNNLKPLMKKEFKNSYQLHPTMETVFKIFPKKMLPNEIGGSAGTRKQLQDKYWEILKINADYFLEEEQTKRLKGDCHK